MVDDEDVPNLERGPLEEFEWPTTLTARAVCMNPTPALFGLGLWTDAAFELSFAELLLTSLRRGNEPSVVEGAAFEVLLAFLAGRHIGEAPVHVAHLVRVCAGAEATAVSAGFATLAHALQSTQQTAFPQLHGDASPLVAALQRRGAGELAPAAELPLAEAVTMLAERLGLDAVALQLCVMLASVPALIGEVRMTSAPSFRAYPTSTPEFVYVGGTNASD